VNPRPQQAKAQAGRLRNELAFHFGDDRSSAFSEHLGEDPRSRPVQKAVGNCRVSLRQLIDHRDAIDGKSTGVHPSAVQNHRQLVGEEFRDAR